MAASKPNAVETVTKSMEFQMPEKATPPLQLTDDDLAEIQRSDKWQIMFKDGDWMLIPNDSSGLPIYVTLPIKADK